MKVHLKFILIAVFMKNLFLLSSILNAVNYYVNDSFDGTEKWCTQPGNDSNNGLATNTPKATITNLLSSYNLTNNDVVYIDSGVYNERIVITTNDDGSSSGYVTFKGVASGNTNSVITGSGASDWQACIEFNNVRYVKLDSLYIKYSGSSTVRGILCKSSTNLLIINNIIVSNRIEGIRAGDGSANPIAYSVFSNNICKYNDRINWDWPSGIVLNNAYSNRIVYNRIIKNGTNSGNGNGIRIEDSCLYNVLSGNTIISNYRKGIDFRDEGAGTENRYNTVRDNIISYNKTDGISGEGYPGTDANNIINNICHHNGADGISFYWNGDNSDDNTIISNICYKNNSDGIYIDGNNNILAYNVCYSNTGYGICMQGGNPITNSFNVCYKNSSIGIFVNTWATVYMRNCTMFKNGSDGFRKNGTAYLRNCISVSNGGWGFNDFNTLTYSDAYGNNTGNYSKAIGTGCITNNPIFITTDSVKSNFLHLSNVSPCIDSGNPDDLVPSGGGINIDMGRYEFLHTNTAYYVNDSLSDNDKFCTAAGNDGNSGTTPSSPKATITNLLSSYNLHSGDWLYIDSGKYTDLITITTNDDGDINNPVIILGAGVAKTVISNSTTSGNIIYVKGENSSVKIKGVKIMNFKFLGAWETVKFEYAENCILSNNIISGYNTATGKGVILWNNCIDNKIINNYIVNTNANSIYVGQNSYSNKIIGNTIMSNKETGIKIDVGNSEHNIIVENNILYNKIGVLLYRGHTIVSNNFIHNNFADGIEINYGGTNNRVVYNMIYSNTKHGIFLNHDGTGAKNNIIMSNNIYNNTNGIIVGVEFNDNTNVKNNRIFRNDIHHNYAEGLIVFGPTNIIISNHIYNNSSHGVRLDYGGRANIIKGNEMNNNGISGLAIFREYNKVTNNKSHHNGNGIEINWDGDYNIIFGNDLYRNWWDGLNSSVNAVSNNIIISNKMHHNSSQGVSMHGGNNKHNKFIGNTVWSNHGDGAGIKVQGDNNVFLYNTCYSNNGNGFLLLGYGGDVTNKFNFCFRNQKNGIYLENFSGGIVVSNTLSTNNKDGLYCTNSDNILIKNNKIINNFDGIRLSNSSSMTLFRNAVYHNNGCGIWLLNGDNCMIYHNSVASNDQNGGYDNLRIDASSTGNRVINNIFVFAKTGIGYGVYIETGGNAELKFNNVYDNVSGNYGGIASAGNGSISAHPEWISYDIYSTNFLYLTNSSPCIDSGTNLGFPYIGAAPDMGWKEFTGKYVKLSITKSISNILLSGNPVVPIPGSSIQYKIVYYITTNLISASNLIIFDKLPISVTYLTDYIISGWTVQYSTNNTPSQDYNSNDYTNIRPLKEKIRWIRWKKHYSGTDTDKILYKITIK